MLTMVSLLLVGGSLGDQFGRRRRFVIGLVAFGGPSILCALAPAAEVLIGAPRRATTPAAAARAQGAPGRGGAPGGGGPGPGGGGGVGRSSPRPSPARS